MLSEAPLVKKKGKLEKFSGKGGWTFVCLPEILQDKKAPFGWRKVRGRIDHVEILQYHLMPMGNGQIFMPVKAAIRKKIKKDEGDWVEVVLFSDNTPAVIPEEFMLCLRDKPKALRNFQELTEQEQMKFIRWIYSVKTEELKVERMAEAIKMIAEKGMLKKRNTGRSPAGIINPKCFSNPLKGVLKTNFSCQHLLRLDLINFSLD